MEIKYDDAYECVKQSLNQFQVEQLERIRDWEDDMVLSGEIVSQNEEGWEEY